jgi:hypothetical protein
VLAPLRNQERVRNNQPVPAGRLRLDRTAGGLAVSLRLLSISGHWTADTLVVGQFSGVVLTGRR